MIAGHITKAEYYAMGERGEFYARHVELLAGEIIERRRRNRPQSIAMVIVRDALQQCFGPQYYVAVRSVLGTFSDSEPEPDIMVVPGQPDDYQDHPTIASLIVEISDPSLALELEQKDSLYASGQFRDYWILNVEKRVLEVFRDPIVDPNAPFGWAYSRRIEVPGRAIDRAARTAHE